VVAATRGSVLKIHSEMASCDSEADGSGVVVAPNRVLLVAQTVAGAETVEVDDGQTKYPAHVVSYDPNAGIAILNVAGLPAAPLELDTQAASPETDALVLGYPDGGDLTTTTVQLREIIKLNGPNLYRTTKVDREVYVINGSAGQGGPLIGRDDKVLGVVTGVDIHNPKTYFALTAKELAAQMSHVGNTEPVSTGACTE
jgi:S1-C subfamily serine protease